MQQRMDKLYKKAAVKQGPTLTVSELHLVIKQVFDEIGSKRYISGQMAQRLREQEGLQSKEDVTKFFIQLQKQDASIAIK